MLGKVKHFICNWFTFGSQTQGLKRERDLSPDDQVDEVAALSNHAPNNKKLRLMTDKNQDLTQGVSQESSHPTKRDLETREQNWSQFLKPSALQTSTPIGSPIPGEAQQLKDRVNPISHSGNLNHIGSKGESNQPLPNIDSGVHSVEDGSSLSQLEKLMAERLGSSAIGAKPKPGIFPMSEAASNLSFHPLARNFESCVKKNEIPSSSRPGNSPSKKSNLTFQRKILNGGIVKPNYRPMIQKLYGSSKQQKSKDFKISLLNTQPQTLAIQNCVRMEEKLYYKALLSQFVSKSSFRKASISTSSPTLSSRSSSGGLLEKSDYKEGQSPIQMQPKRSGIVIELDNESSTSDKTPVATNLQSPIKPLVRINTLEDALAQSPQYDCQFIAKIKSRYSAKERERKRLLDEEAIRSKVLAKNRAEWENDLEQRLCKQLAIVTRPVIDERVEEVVRLPEISEDMQKVIDGALNGQRDAEILCDAFNLTITRRDIKTLAGLNWLNDQVINFYLTLVMERSNSGDWPKVFAFNTFFYPKLMSSGHAGLKRWTRKVDLFQQDFILIPVHLGLHWCLATVSPKEQAIRYYDSMGGRNIECLNGLKRYMEAESLDKKKTVLDTSSWKLECVENIPQQMNGSDCGMFTCKYAEYLSRRAKITFEQKDMPYFRRRMVYEIITQKLSYP